jgi:hypothetical protein
MKDGTFSISRIHTAKGIFRLSGVVKDGHLEYSSAEFMGSDGWCELELTSLPAKTLLSELEQDVAEHLS